MHSYRFKLYSDNFEDFLMELELKSNQTFLEFHNAIKQYCKINSNEFASFFICDDKWRKKSEITLVEIEIEESNQNNNKKIIKEMKDVVLNTVIINPHQKFLYVYDFLNLYTFYVELTHIKQVTEKDKFPKLIKKEGEINLTKISDLHKTILEDDFSDISNETFFGEEADPEDFENLETDLFYGKPDEF